MNRLLLPLILLLVQDPAPDIAKKEKEVQTTLGAEMLRLAKFCIAEKSYADAKTVIARGLEILPGNKPLQDELKKIPAKDATPKAGYAKKFADEKKKADQKCGDAMADLALKYGTAGLTEKFEKQLWQIQKYFPSDKVFQKAGAVLFEPYMKFVARADAQRLEAGQEFVDGKWISGDVLAAANKKHATWSDPWIVSDEIHELKTTLPLRTAKRVLSHVAAFRTFFLQKFAGLWDLRPPNGKLPIILTETQADLRARMKEFSKDPEGMEKRSMNGAAYYMQTNGSLSPCFVTLEPCDANGGTHKINVDEVMMVVRHEVTHQLAFEYCKYDFDPSKGVEHHFWSVEAIATYMMVWVFDKGEWRLTKPKRIEEAGGYLIGDFAWCKEHLDEIPPLGKFFAQSHEEFMTVANYHIAATAAWFLFEGEEGKYRTAFARLLETVHKVHDTATTFRDSFKDVDFTGMQDEWQKFVAAIELD